MVLATLHPLSYLLHVGVVSFIGAACFTLYKKSGALPQTSLPTRLPTPFCGPYAHPLPGSQAYKQLQAEADCHDMAQVARHLRACVADIKPYITRLDCKTYPLAVLECCPTLLGLAEEIEQDDIPTRQQDAD